MNVLFVWAAACPVNTLPALAQSPRGGAGRISDAKKARDRRSLNVHNEHAPNRLVKFTAYLLKKEGK